MLRLLAVVASATFFLGSASHATSLATGPFYVRFEGPDGSAERRVDDLKTIAQIFESIPESGVFICSTAASAHSAVQRRADVRRTLINLGVPIASIIDGLACQQTDTGRKPEDTPRDAVLVQIGPSRMLKASASRRGGTSHPVPN